MFVQQRTSGPGWQGHSQSPCSIQTNLTATGLIYRSTPWWTWMSAGARCRMGVVAKGKQDSPDVAINSVMLIIGSAMGMSGLMEDGSLELVVSPGEGRHVSQVPLCCMTCWTPLWWPWAWRWHPISSSLYLAIWRTKLFQNFQYAISL